MNRLILGGQTIGGGATLTINSPVFDSDGDLDDPLTLAANGSQLIVNGPAQWTAVAAISANPSGAGTATISADPVQILTPSLTLRHNLDGRRRDMLGARCDFQAQADFHRFYFALAEAVANADAPPAWSADSPNRPTH